FPMVRFARSLDTRAYFRMGEIVEEKASTPWDQEANFNWVRNWCTFFGKSSRKGVAVIFPQKPRFNYRVVENGFQGLDEWNFVHFRPKAGDRLAHVYYFGMVQDDVIADTRRLASEILNCIPASDAFSYYHPTIWPPKHIENTANVLSEGDECTIWCQDPGALTFPDALPPSTSQRGIKVSAASNECEPIQIVLRPKRKLRDVRLCCTDMAGDGARILAENVEYFFVDSTQVDYQRTENWAKPLIWHTGPIPDPFGLSQARDLAPGVSHPIWIRLNVPRGQNPGTYSGHLKIWASGRVLAEVPLSVRVWNFELPRVTHLKTQYQLWGYDEVRRNWKRYYRDLGEHKVSCGVFLHEPKVSFHNGSLSVDFSAWDSCLSLVIDELGFNCIKLPNATIGGGGGHISNFLGHRYDDPRVEKPFRQYLRMTRHHLEEMGWSDRFFGYLFDEPGEHVIPIIKNAARIMEEEFPQLKTFVASSFHSEAFKGHVDIWCPQYILFNHGHFDGTFVQGARTRGESIWWYNPPHALGMPLIGIRLLPWLNWKYSVQGILLWSINYWKEDNWRDMRTAGEGMLVYPGGNGPRESVRWEMVREGMEDFEYIRILQRELDNALSNPANQTSELIVEVKALFSHIRNNLLPDHPVLFAKPGDVYAARTRIAILIERLKKLTRRFHGPVKNLRLQH
ncbi:MAG TPA: DUF4091 domain-containing protein, partial [Desulfobacterales bacterium]|nr:DUF4091 domain-containing protein [Desulfobacterales bacterium]